MDTIKRIRWSIKCVVKTLLAVVCGLLWALVPKRIRPDRPWQRKGIGLVKHDSHSRSGNVYALYFGPGAGYIGGATAYIGLGCRVRNKYYGFSSRRFAIGLTGNANNVPLAGRY